MFNMTTTSGKEGRHDHVEIDVVGKYINARLSKSLHETCVARQLTLMGRLAQFHPFMVSQTDYAFELIVGPEPSKFVLPYT